MAPQLLLRHLAAFAAATLSASAVVALLAVGQILLDRSFTQLDEVSLFALWVASETVPLALVSCVVAAPFLFFIHRKRSLRLSLALCVFVPAMLLAVLLQTPQSSRIATEPLILLVTALGVYTFSGVIAGLAYWAIAKTPSNTTVEPDARRNSARGSP
jgi:hypothetical protein